MARTINSRIINFWSLPVYNGGPQGIINSKIINSWPQPIYYGGDYNFKDYKCT